jgi:hypothetical protein
VTFANGIIPNSTSGIVGVTNGSNANAGVVGEYVSSTVASGSAVALTTNVFANITSISLTAGDWDISGTVALVNATGTANFIYANGCISTTSATIGSLGQSWGLSYTTAQAIAYYTDFTQATPTTRLSLSGTTTIYLTARGVFTGGTVNAYGIISARRRR